MERNSQPFVSVIIPTHNRGYIITKSIESILNQTYKNFEIIVVDDQSTDNTRKIIEAIGDKRIRYFCLEKKLGAGGARQKGVDLAKYEYVAFHDSDDIAYSNKLEVQLQYLIHHNFDAVVAKFKLINSSGKVQVIPPFDVNDSKNMNQRILKSNFVGTPLLLAKKQILIDEQFDLDLDALEDWDLGIRLIYNHKLGFINEVLYEAKVQSNSLSVNKIKEYQNLIKIYKKCDSLNILNSTRAVMYYNLYLYSCMANDKNRDYLISSIKTYPTIKAIVRLVFSWI